MTYKKKERMNRLRKLDDIIRSYAPFPIVVTEELSRKMTEAFGDDSFSGPSQAVRDLGYRCSFSDAKEGTSNEKKEANSR